MDAVKKDSPPDRVMVEIFSKAILKRYDSSGSLIGYFRAETSGWTTVLNATAMHCEQLAIDSFAVLSRFIRKEKLELDGEAAYYYITRLWELTPGARFGRAVRFPEPTADEMKLIELVKFFDEEFGKTSLHFRFPSKKMIGHMIGRDARNRKHLSKVLGEGASVYPFINPEVTKLPVEQSLEPAGQVA